MGDLARKFVHELQQHFRKGDELLRVVARLHYDLVISFVAVLANPMDPHLASGRRKVICIQLLDVANERFSGLRSFFDGNMHQ